MNFIEFVARLCLSFGIASILSIAVSIVVLLACWLLVYFLKLNYGTDAYWAINLSIASLYLAWVVGFAYFMTVIK